MEQDINDTMSLSSKEILKRFEIGVRRGVASALAEHKKAGRSIFISRNGQIIEIPPEKIQVPPEDIVSSESDVHK